MVATPNDGYELEELKAGGIDIMATKKFTVTADIEVTAVFGKKEGNDNNDNNDQEPLAVEESLLASLTVSPNPFTVQLRIVNPKGVTVAYELVNLSGVVVRSGVINGSEVIIDTEALPAGLYFARLMGQNGAKRVVKVSNTSLCFIAKKTPLLRAFSFFVFCGCGGSPPVVEMGRGEG